MLTQQKADQLMGTPKMLVNSLPIPFPLADDFIYIEAKSTDGRESFVFDVNRKGRIKLKKCTYMERYAVTEVLLRLDIDGPPHTNPDGEEFPCPHLHTYREGYGDKWAAPLPSDFTNPGSLTQTLMEFLRYSNVIEVPQIQLSIN